MTDTQSRKTSNWPKSLLWLVVIAFGAFYLNAMRERSIGEAAREQAQQASSPSVLVTESSASATGTASPLADLERPGGDASAAIPGSEDAAAKKIPAQAEAMTTASQEDVVPSEARADAATSSLASATDSSQAESSQAESAPGVVNRPSAGGSSKDQGPTRPSWNTSWNRLPGRASVAERRARLLAEYAALWQSVEAQRRQIWEEMNRLDAGARPGYAYPLPYPFSDLRGPAYNPGPRRP